MGAYADSWACSISHVQTISRNALTPTCSKVRTWKISNAVKVSHRRRSLIGLGLIQKDVPYFQAPISGFPSDGPHCSCGFNLSCSTAKNCFVKRTARLGSLPKHKLFGLNSRINQKVHKEDARSHSSTVKVNAQKLAAAEETASSYFLEDFDLDTDDKPQKRSNKRGNSSGASSVSSGVRLENISKTFKGAQILKDCSWEVKKGERVGLVGVNGAGECAAPCHTSCCDGKFHAPILCSCNFEYILFLIIQDDKNHESVPSTGDQLAIT